MIVEASDSLDKRIINSVLVVRGILMRVDS